MTSNQQQKQYCTMKSVMYHIIPSAELLGSSIKVQTLTSGLIKTELNL